MIDHSIDNIWPCRYRPKPDELLSSWIVRLSAGLVVRLQTFTTKHLAMHSGFWTGDVDRKARHDLLKTLAENTNISYENALNTTLSSYQGKLWNEFSERHLAWITGIGRYGRWRNGFGQQYCRLCLINDQEPYFRKKWRLAFHVTCLEHRIYLRDCCNGCSSPIEFHTGDFGVKLLPEKCRITICRHCHSDLRNEGLHEDIEAPDEILKIQGWMNDCLVNSYGSIDGLNTYPSILIFSGLRRLISIQTSSTRTNRISADLKRSYGQLELTENYPNHAHFESLRIGDRTWALLGLLKLLENWPNEFVSRFRNNRISSSYLIPYRNGLPYWLSSILDWYLNDEDYSPSEHERQSAADYLKRHDYPVNQSNINLLLGTSAVSVSSKSPRTRWNPRGIPNI